VSIPQNKKKKPDNKREKLPVLAFGRIFELVTCQFLDGGRRQSFWREEVGRISSW
jgi:hypothetical protein